MPDNKIKLLIAVESVMIRGSIKKILSSSNLAIYFASGDEETLITLRDKQPHIVIVDWNLPKRGAAHVLKIANEASLNAEFIVLASDKDNTTGVGDTYSKVRKFLSLPIQKSELSAEIAEILQEKSN